MSDTLPVAQKLYERGVILDPEKHAALKSAADYGVTFPEPSYPIDKTGGIEDLGMGGNGPDPKLTVNKGNPMGDCGPNACPKNVNQTTAVLAGVKGFKAMTSNAVAKLYATFCAITAGSSWRPKGTNWVLPEDLDTGVEPIAWLDYCFKEKLIPGWLKIDLKDLDAALAADYAVIVAVALNPQADNQFPDHWDVGPGDEPDPEMGHFITYGFAESKSGPFKWGSWGAWATSTLAWKDACPQQAYVVLTEEETKAPWFPALEADLKAMGGTVAPAPAPKAEEPTPLGPWPEEQLEAAALWLDRHRHPSSEADAAALLEAIGVKA